MLRSKGPRIREALVRIGFFLSVWAAFLFHPFHLRAIEYNAGPSDYRGYLNTLQPGDILNLAAGNYTDGLSITDRIGQAHAPIIISGPATGAPAVFIGNASRNTVSIRRSAYIVLRRLTMDGQDIAYIDAIKAEGDAGNWAHDITIEYCTITGHDANQSTVGISTKAPSWDWIIRYNTVHSAGTGLYLGNSNGEAPFIRGLIEYNLILNPVGYCLQIKHQNPRPDLPNMPGEGSTTTIRHNVFIKDDDPSDQGDRPNLLVGHFPTSGTGTGDLYEIYGNLFYHNPREALFQGEGNIHLHDNIFVDAASGWPAINIRPHNDVPKEIAVYHNTIFSADTGISISGEDSRFNQMVVGNVICAQTPLQLGSNVTAAENLSFPLAEASNMFMNASLTLGQMDLYPQAGQLTGTDLTHHLTNMADDEAFDRDFNGRVKDFSHRGAYQGSAGVNPGWPLAAEIKTIADDSGADDPGDTPENDGDSGSTDGSAASNGSGGGGGCFMSIAGR